MKIRHLLIPLVLLYTVFARAESTDSSTTAPKSPAPAANSETTSAPHRIIYIQRLPTAADLTAVAAAQKLVISKIEIAATQVNVAWHAADSPTTVVSYRLLSSINTASHDKVRRGPPGPIFYEPYYPRYYGYPYGYSAFSVGFRGGFGGGFGGRHGRWR